MNLFSVLKRFLPILLFSLAFYFTAFQEVKAVGGPYPYQMPVLSLRYFPLQSGTNNLNLAITGMDDNWITVDANVSALQGQTVTALNEASKYHGYSNSGAQSSLNYSVIQNLTYFQALPLGAEYIYKPGQQVYRPDYRQILNNLNICDYVDNQGVKEVWLWGYHTGPEVSGAQAPYTEPTESNMSMGRNSQSFWNYGAYGDVSNSEQIDDMPVCNKTYYLYNYNYGRGLGEAMEDHGHQMEATYNFIDPFLFWFNFVTPYGQSGQTNHCGWTHYAPNSTIDYEWDNPTPKASNCADWRPDGSGQVQQVNCYTWPPYTCPSVISDNGANFKKWWMQNIPGYQNGLTFEGANLRNWWDFIGDFDAAIAEGKSLTDATIVADTTPPSGTLSVSPTTANPGQTITITITGNDNVDVNQIQAFYSGSWYNQSCDGTQTSCTRSWTTSEPTAGNYSYCGYVFDSASNGAWTSPDCITVTVVSPDTTPPVSAIVSPAEGSWQNTNFPVAISDLDSGGSGLPYCEYKIQSVPGLWVTTRDWTERLCDSSVNIIVGSDCSFQGENACRVNVQSRDGAGLWSPTASRDFSIDRTAPSVGAISPVIAVANTATTFSATVSDNSGGMAGCWLYAPNTPGGAVVNQGVMTISGGQASRIHTFASVGNYSAFVYCADLAGNFSEGAPSNIAVSAVADLPPDGSLTISPNPANVGQTISVTISGTDDQGINWLLFVDGPSQLWYSCGGMTNCSNTWTVTKSSVGNYLFESRIWDTAGQSKYVSDTAEVINNQAGCNSELFLSPAEYCDCASECRTNSCLANNRCGYDCLAPQSPESDQISFGGSCNVRIYSKGYDYSDAAVDGGAVVYNNYELGPNYRTTTIDDNPSISSDCDLDLQFRNSWSASQDQLSIATEILGEQSANNLGGGFSVVPQGAGCSYSFSGPGPTFSCSNTSNDFLIGESEPLTSRTFDIEFCGDGETNCGEACDSSNPGDPNRSSCNPDCALPVDTTPPTSKIWNVKTLEGGDIGFTPGTLIGDYSAFLRAESNGYAVKAYVIYVNDSDNTGGSGLDTCYIEVNGVTRTRACNSGRVITVGRPETGADCTVEENNNCKVKVWAKDRAGVENLVGVNLTDLAGDERNYFLYNFNKFDFGVDWTPPTAQ